MTTANDVIARQLTLSGEALFLALEPLSGKKFYRENRNGSSAAWTAGHLACVADLFRSWFAGGELLFGEEFHRVFNDTAVVEVPASNAAKVDPWMYPKDLLLLRLRESLTAALLVLREFGGWDEPPPPGVPVTLLTGGAVWERLGVHIYWHLGELAGSMPTFFGTYTLNILPHHLYVPLSRATRGGPACPMSRETLTG